MKIQVGPISGRSYFWPVLFLAGLISGKAGALKKRPALLVFFLLNKHVLNRPPILKINRLFQ
jgi:hypothetical protein